MCALQALHERAVPYLQIRKALVSRLVSTAGILGLGQASPVLVCAEGLPYMALSSLALAIGQLDWGCFTDAASLLSGASLASSQAKAALHSQHTRKVPVSTFTVSIVSSLRLCGPLP